MNKGAITGYLDVAQIVLYVFWLFFFGLIIYLRKEDKREGYPLESDRSGGRINVQGFPAIPAAKSFELADGGLVLAPRIDRDSRSLNAAPAGSYLGAPLNPIGNPLLSGVGPASYALRANHPDHTIDGQPLIVPTRIAPGYTVSSQDPDPRGMDVVGADRVSGGTVTDLWVDRAEPQIRYLELATTAGRHVLLPMTFAKVDGDRRRVNVRSILGSQFAQVPGIANPDQVTRLEEDQIVAYYAGGTFVRHALALGAVAMSHDDFDFEPMPGLPAALPPGERLLWQGTPDWKALAINAYHVVKAAIYFALLIAWRIGFGIYRGDANSTIALSCAFLALLGSLAVAVLGVLAYCSARSAIYSITSRRVLLRHGIAVPLTLNVPFGVIRSAALKRRSDAIGDIALALNAGVRIGYLLTWPYLKPGNIANAQPSLRAVKESSDVAAILAAALAADAGQAAVGSYAAPLPAAHDAAVDRGRRRASLAGSGVAAA